MIILRIEHEVASFDAWKNAFDSDPIDRKRSGVRRYHIYQPIEEPNYVIIDLEFDDMANAKTTQTALQNMMTKVVGTLVMGPSIKILNEIESKAYG